MLHELQRSGFLRPRERLYELLTLQQADSRAGLSLKAGTEALLDHRTLVGCIAHLEAQALLVRRTVNGSERHTLTEAGRRRLHFLIVDFARELSGLHSAARELLRRSLIPLALDGVRTVAFYPFGETAEAAFTAMDGLGFELVAIVDDAPTKQDLRFHHLRVSPPSILRELAPDAVIVTTAVFQDRIIARLEAMELPMTRIHSF